MLFLEKLEQNKIYVICILLICILVGAMYSLLFTPREYVSSATVLLIKNNTESGKDGSVELSDSLISTFKEIVKSDLTIAEAKRKLNLNIKNSELEKNINLERNSLSDTFKIEVQNIDSSVAVSINKEIVKVFSNKIKEMYGNTEVYIVDEAHIVKSTYGNSIILSIGLSFLAGLIINICYVVVLIRLEKKIRSVSDIESDVFLKTLVEIPVNLNKKVELIAYDSEKSEVSKAFKKLKTNIQFFNVNNNNKKIILTTSSSKSEGKSYVSANMAISFAEVGKKVVLIDADMNTGRQGKIFNIPNNLGLSNYLSGLDTNGVEINEFLNKFINETAIKNLNIITSGTVPPNSSELLTSPKLLELIKDLSVFYDVVIIDGTPILTTTDSLVLTRIANSTVIVVDYKNTKKEDLIKTKKDIQNVGGRIIGVVLNKVKPKEAKVKEEKNKEQKNTLKTLRVKLQNKANEFRKYLKLKRNEKKTKLLIEAIEDEKDENVNLVKVEQNIILENTDNKSNINNKKINKSKDKKTKNEIIDIKSDNIKDDNKYNEKENKDNLDTANENNSANIQKDYKEKISEITNKMKNNISVILSKTKNGFKSVYSVAKEKLSKTNDSILQNLKKIKEKVVDFFVEEIEETNISDLKEEIINENTDVVNNKNKEQEINIKVDKENINNEKNFKTEKADVQELTNEKNLEIKDSNIQNDSKSENANKKIGIKFKRKKLNLQNENLSKNQSLNEIGNTKESVSKKNIHTMNKKEQNKNSVIEPLENNPEELYEYEENENAVLVIVDAENAYCRVFSKNCFTEKLIRGIDKTDGFLKAHYSSNLLNKRRIALIEGYNLTKEQAKRIDSLIYITLCDYDDCVWMDKKIASNKAEAYVLCMAKEYEKQPGESEREYIIRCQRLRKLELMKSELEVEYKLDNLWKTKKMTFSDKIVLNRFARLYEIDNRFKNNFEIVKSNKNKKFYDDIVKATDNRLNFETELENTDNEKYELEKNEEDIIKAENDEILKQEINEMEQITIDQIANEQQMKIEKEREKAERIAEQQRLKIEKRKRNAFKRKERLEENIRKKEERTKLREELKEKRRLEKEKQKEEARVEEELLEDNLYPKTKNNINL